jgi:NitT/TauT family transport system ATP-binding protein
MITDSQALLDTGQIIFGIIVIGLIGLVTDFACSRHSTAALFPWALCWSDARALDPSKASRDLPRPRTAGPTLALQPTDLDRRRQRLRHHPRARPAAASRRCCASSPASTSPPPAACTLDGAPVSGPGADRGMVFQSYTLFPWLTVAQNIRFGLRERGMPRPSSRPIADAFIAKVGLRGFEHHWPQAALGRHAAAHARWPGRWPTTREILLLDEPFGALDNQTRELMQELLQGIWEADRKTVLFVTHDIDEAIFMANRVVVMSARPGRIKCDRRRSTLPNTRATIPIKTTPVFMDLKARLTEEIRVEVQRAAGLVAA